MEQYADRIELTNEMIYRKMDRLVRERELYRNHNLTMDDVADMLGTNRTYLSRAVNCYAGGFVKYMMNLRVEGLHRYISEADEGGRLLEDGEDLAMKTGFVNKRAMVRAVKKIDGVTFYTVRKKRLEPRKKEG
ncbi:MAG: helix-turn-helix transcriptional regulator [Alistipes sp.]|nr:helix-turn-helix transcriptional regulator [Candidatus Minthomonas equi]